MAVKYVVFENGGFVLVPITMNHSDVTGCGTPVSAGFARITSRMNEFDDIRYDVCCYGGSYSLTLETRGTEDEKIIARGLAL